MDIVPTVADALGYTIEGAEGLPGLSLLKPVPATRTLYHAPRSYSAALSLRSGKRKFIAWSRRPAQLFDLETDPDERRDLAADGTAPEVEEEMRRAWIEVQAWKDGVAASYAEQARRTRN